MSRPPVEQAPIPDGRGTQRGVVAEGPVGARWAGRPRIFRYEVRRWPDGVIPDAAEAVESPHRLTNDPRIAQRLWDFVPDLPTPVWGRDELGAGEMWNSNSVVSWLLVRSGLPIEAIQRSVDAHRGGTQALWSPGGGCGSVARCQSDRPGDWSEPPRMAWSSHAPGTIRTCGLCLRRR
jgi:hypothetical protein